jgi:ribosomal protein S18 acetylase RimI-like enzyme
MSTVVKKIPFEADLLPLVQGFDCSEVYPPKFWEQEINEWIQMEPEEGDGALYWLAQGRGTQIWLYANDNNEVIGYGSLCPSRWPDPSVIEQAPKIKKIPISLIPAVGINRRFQGGPDGVEKGQKYSRKIMNHLVHEARKHLDRWPFLGLYVHPQNEKAIRLYLTIGFQSFSQKCHVVKAGLDYPSMILKLAEYPHVEE